MPPDIVKRMPARTQSTFKRAYDNKLKRPIGWWEPDDLAVGLLQAWLVGLGESLPKSTSIDPNGDIDADGVFAEETFDAVKSFQRKAKLKADGMVGHDTLDALRAALLKKNFTSPVVTTSEVIIKAIPVPRQCPPGALICAEPTWKFE